MSGNSQRSPYMNGSNGPSGRPPTMMHNDGSLTDRTSDRSGASSMNMSALSRPLSTSFGDGLRAPVAVGSMPVRRESETSVIGEVTCSGYLLKRGRTRPVRRWRKRYFALKHGVLRYYKTHDSAECLGFITMQVAAVTMNNADQRSFTLDTGSVVYHLRAENEDSRRTWVHALLRSKADVNVLLTTKTPRESRPESMRSHMGDGSLQNATAKLSSSLDALLYRIGQMLPANGPDPLARESAAVRSALVDVCNVALSAGQSSASGAEIEDLRLQLAKKETMERHYNDMFDEMINLLSRAESVRSSAGGVPTAKAKALTQLVQLSGGKSRGTSGNRNSRRGKAEPVLDGDMSSDSEEFYDVEGEEEEEIDDEDGDEDEDDDKEEEISPNKLVANSIERRNSARVLAQSISAAPGTMIANKLSAYGHPLERRKVLPNTRAKMKAPSLWSIIRGAIGKDLFRVSMPVSLFEPLCMLQRVMEDLTFSELLDTAYACETSLERMVYVAAFAVSSYSTTTGRMGKPFNPILGETFEYVDVKRGFRFVSEQVSHHPPISAMYAESDRWVMYENWNCKNKFWGKSIEVFHQGWEHIAFPKHQETYSFRKVTTAVHNIILGNMWIDHYGDMKITNDSTGEYAVVTFEPGTMRITGAVFDTRATKRYTITGKWTEKLICKEFPPNKTLIFERPPDIENKYEYFNFTEFACGLNELTPELMKVLPHTDTRWRPDQREFENAQIEKSGQEKHRLEEIQREARKMLEVSGQTHQAKFFKLGKDPLGREGWFFNMEYWKMRDSGDYSRLAKLW